MANRAIGYLYLEGYSGALNLQNALTVQSGGTMDAGEILGTKLVLATGSQFICRGGQFGDTASPGFNVQVVTAGTLNITQAVRAPFTSTTIAAAQISVDAGANLNIAPYSGLVLAGNLPGKNVPFVLNKGTFNINTEASIALAPLGNGQPTPYKGMIRNDGTLNTTGVGIVIAASVTNDKQWNVKNGQTILLGPLWAGPGSVTAISGTFKGAFGPNTTGNTGLFLQAGDGGLGFQNRNDRQDWDTSTFFDGATVTSAGGTAIGVPPPTMVLQRECTLAVYSGKVKIDSLQQEHGSQTSGSSLPS
jgi:hypothetical protein